MEKASIVRWTHGEPLPPEVLEYASEQETPGRPMIYWQHFGTIPAKSLRSEDGALSLLIQVIPKDEQQLAFLEGSRVNVILEPLMHKGPESADFEWLEADTGVDAKVHSDFCLRRGSELPIYWALEDFLNDMPSLYILISDFAVLEAQSGYDYIFGGTIDVVGKSFEINLPPIGIRYDPYGDAPTSRFVYTASIEDEDQTFSVPPTGVLYDFVCDFFYEGMHARATYSILSVNDDDLEFYPLPYRMWCNLLAFPSSSNLDAFRVIVEHEGA
ncbi:hypothetical protein VTN31DRAFT_5421 [Thermomyces dupontii]|uniref:uncharacterized protein n=1 Tax=Talaromyces thermophilus TaxID=28565 RepID=UPI0037435684